MKICDLTQSYTGTSGGIRTYIDEKRSFIRERTDWEHVLIVPGDKDRSTRDGKLTLHEIASPFIPGCEPYRVALRLARVISLLEAEQPDIIELGCAYTLPWAAFRHHKTHKSKIIGFFHTDFPSAYVETAVSAALGEAPARTAKTLASQYARIVYNQCDLTLTPSRTLKKNLSRYGIRNVEYMPLGVNTEIFNPVRRNENLREMLGAGPDHLLLMYSGRLDSEKRIPVLVEAIKKLPQALPVVLALVGEGPLRKGLQTPEKRDRRITIVPYLSDKTELAALLASADIYVTAGPFETFGLSVLEAQSCGLPVVGVKAGALEERVNPSTGILGAVDDPSDLALNILELARSDFREMGREARRMVERMYSWERTFERLFAAYRKIAGE